MKNLFKEAHKLTREIKAEFKEVDYQAQFSICLSYLLNNKEEKGMVELKGSEKQIAWAEEIRETMVTCLGNKIKAASEKYGNVEMPEKSRENFNSGINFLTEKLEEIKQEEKATWFINNRDHLNKGSILGLGFVNKEYTEIHLIELFNIDPASRLAKIIGAINKAKKEYIELF